MMQTKKEQIRVMWALVRRDIFVLRQGLRDDLINSAVKVSVLFFVLGVLGIYFGFRASVAQDVMIGAVVSVFLSRGFVCAITDSFDMSDARFIDYKRVLPLSTSMMLLSKLCSYIITLAVSTLPLFVLAKLYLQDAMPLGNIQWIAFFIMYCASMVCLSAFFLSIIFCVSFDWFRFNIWQRVLIPMNSFGCIMFSWKRLYFFSPLFARALLINPCVFIVEGLRASIFGNDAYISVYYCVPVVCLWAVVAVGILLRYVGKRVEAGV